EELLVVLDLALPAVDGLDARDDVDAGGEPPRDEPARDLEPLVLRRDRDEHDAQVVHSGTSSTATPVGASVVSILSRFMPAGGAPMASWCVRGATSRMSPRRPERRMATAPAARRRASTWSSRREAGTRTARARASRSTSAARVAPPR